MIHSETMNHKTLHSHPRFTFKIQDTKKSVCLEIPSQNHRNHGSVEHAHYDTQFKTEKDLKSQNSVQLQPPFSEFNIQDMFCPTNKRCSNHGSYTLSQQQESKCPRKLLYSQQFTYNYCSEGNKVS